MHVHNGQNIQKIPTKVEIFKISLQIRIVYVPNKTVYRGKFTKIRVACIHGYSGLKSSITTQKGIFISLNSYFSFTELTSGGNYEEAGAAIKMREKSHLLEEDSFS